MNHKRKLTAKEELFCQEYMKDLNQTQAYIRAGYKNKHDRKAASLLFAKLDIQSRIQELFKTRIETVKIDADYVLRRFIEIDQLDVSDLLNEDGTVKAVKDWSKAWKTSVTAFDIQEFFADGCLDSLVKKVKFPDKLKNLELLGRHIAIQAFGKEDINDQDEPEKMSFPYSVREAVGEVKVTIGSSDA